MGVFDSSYIKAVGIKWPGLKKIFSFFSDTLVDITHSGFSINEQTLLVRLGKVFSIRAHLACQARRVSE